MTKVALLLASGALLAACSRPHGLGTDTAANHDTTNPRNPGGQEEPAHPTSYDETVANDAEQAAAMPDGRANQGGTGPAAAEGSTLSGTTGGSIPPPINEPAAAAENEKNPAPNAHPRRRAQR